MGADRSGGERGAGAKALFHPRPEARAMRWDQLFCPVQNAVQDLLCRVHGAEIAAGQTAGGGPHHDLSSHFLVYGDRGSGKTTVLFNAREATERPREFFEAGSPHDGDDGEPRPHTPEEKARFAKWVAQREQVRDEARSAASYLHDHVEWLDILDIEAMPPKANLLTMLLVRIQDALDPKGNGEAGSSGEQMDRQGISALFDEGPGGAHSKIGSLLRDASFVWEDIHEPDTRTRAERQVSAAQIYTSFRARFVDAMGAVSRHLSRKRNKLSLVLPIDNVDRSTDHLYSIIRLAQLVSGKHLWIVLAGDRVDIDTFLQRAFWKELIKTGEGAVVGGRERVAGEDEALSIARRQAAAAGAKVMPIAHRIKVQPVSAFESIRSRLPPKRGLTLERKLERFGVGRDHGATAAAPAQAGAPDPSARETGATPRSLRDLACIHEFLSDEAARRVRRGRQRLSFAAWLALRLPVRSLIDLHQLLDELEPAEDQDRKEGSAERLLRGMFQHSVDRAGLPEWASKRLQESVLGRDHRARTVLALPGNGLENTDTVALMAVIPLRDGGESPTDAAIHLSEQIDIRISMKRFGARRSEDHDDEVVSIPPGVVGWLMLLHDVLAFSEHPVLFQDESLIHAPPVSTRHLLRTSLGARPLTVDWPSPPLSTFWEANLFQLLWKPFGGPDTQPWAGGPDSLVARWIDAALLVGRPGARRRQPPRESLEDVLYSVLGHAESEECGLMDLRSWEAGHAREVRSWIEERLPLLLLPEILASSSVSPGAAETTRALLGDPHRSGRILAARRALLRKPLAKLARSAGKKGRDPLADLLRRAGEDEPDDLRGDLVRAATDYLDRGVPPALRVGAEQAPSEQPLPKQAPSKQAPSKQAPSKQAPSKQAPSKKVARVSFEPAGPPSRGRRS